MIWNDKSYQAQITWCRSPGDVLPRERRQPRGRPCRAQYEDYRSKSSEEENPPAVWLRDGGGSLHHPGPADSALWNVVQCQQSLVSSIIPQWDGNVLRLFIKSSIVVMFLGKPPLYAWLLRQEIRNIQREHWDQIFLNLSFLGISRGRTADRGLMIR